MLGVKVKIKQGQNSARF